MTVRFLATGPAATPLSWRARLGFALAAALGSMLVNQFVYLNTPVTTDENSYVFQAQTFLEGRLTRPCPPVPPAFHHEMIIMDSQVGWLSRYPPAHALWLLPGVRLGQPRLMVALAAAVSVWFLSGSALWLGGSALAVCLALLFSPYFQFMHGTLLSHTSGLMAVSVLWWAYVRWQSGGHARWAAVAGVAWGFLFLNRTYTGLLIALPLGLDAAVRLALRWRRGSQWLGSTLFGLTALAGVGAYLLYNHLALGDPSQSIHLYYADEWALGFSDSHRLWEGLQMAVQNLRLLDRWLWGSPGSLLVLGAAAVIGWSAAWTPVCAGCLLAIVLGHVAFSFPGFNTCGPYYYFETLPFAITLVGLAAARLRRWRYAPGLFVVLTLALVGASLAFMKQEARRTRKDRTQDTRAWAALRQAPPHALVFVTGFREDVGRQLVFNPQGVRSDPLVVANWGEKNRLVAAAFPDRTCYWLKPGRDRVEPINPPP
jgi:hypothetical protein